MTPIHWHKDPHVPLKILQSTSNTATNRCTYLKKSDSDLNVLWYRPHHNSSVGIFYSWLPAVGLQHTKKKKIIIYVLIIKFCLSLFLKTISQIQTLDDFRRLLRVQTTTNLSGCLVGKKQKRKRQTLFINPAVPVTIYHVNISRLSLQMIKACILMPEVLTQSRSQCTSNWQKRV